jgi:hypothetical protein
VSLTGAEVSAFLLAECTRCSVGAAKGRVAELRALLRYLLELGPARIEEFLVDRRADRYRQVPCRRGLVLLLEHLVGENVIVAIGPPPQTALEDLVDAYRAWLLHERGLAAATVLRYVNTARRFLLCRA